MGTAVLFPGQGSQVPGMRAVVERAAPELLERCEALVGDDPFARVDESTRFAQPAIFCASLAGWRELSGEAGGDLVAVAGHSLGELTALVAAGALDPFDALALVVERGRLMAGAGGGTMLALLGASDERATELAREHGVAVANFNAPGQVVLSGEPGALDAVAAAARAEQVKALELGVAGAFHSPAMEPAVAPFRAALERVAFRPPAVPVVSCATAAPMRDPRDELAAALVSPVRWSSTMQALAGLGADRFVDAGPGRVLAKLVKRNMRETARA